MKELIDHNGQRVQKCEVAVESINKIIRELYMRAMRENKIRNYYDIAVIGYSNEEVFSLLGGDIDNPFVAISDLCSESCVKLQNVTPISRRRATSGSTIEVTASGSTPMYEALYYVYQIVREWCSKSENFESFPPFVLNITDGHPTDCDLDSIVDISKRIQSVGTNDGETLLFNIHLESDGHRLKEIFPTDEEICAHHDAYVRMLGLSSSVVPTHFEDLVVEMRGRRREGHYRGMGYNVSVADLISMMTIGTLSAPMK